MPDQSTRRSLSQVIKWILGAIAVFGLVAWWATKPSDEQLQREDICKKWGYTDSASLQKCRHSQAEADAVISPAFNRRQAALIKEFNNALALASQRKTVTATNEYDPITLDQLDKLIPPFATLHKIPFEDRRFRVQALVLTETPDPNDDASEHEWNPRSYELWPTDIKKISPSLPVKLDIESLNRNERKFIQDMCDDLFITPCKAIVYGHIGPIDGLDDAKATLVGLIVDQLDIQPVTSPHTN